VQLHNVQRKARGSVRLVPVPVSWMPWCVNSRSSEAAEQQGSRGVTRRGSWLTLPSLFFNDTCCCIFDEHDASISRPLQDAADAELRSIVFGPSLNSHCKYSRAQHSSSPTQMPQLVCPRNTKKRLATSGALGRTRRHWRHAPCTRQFTSRIKARSIQNRFGLPRDQ
jgi:hypothetical protein